MYKIVYAYIDEDGIARIKFYQFAEENPAIEFCDNLEKDDQCMTFHATYERIWMVCNKKIEE